VIEAPKIAIAPEETQIVLRILESRIPDRSVWVFGSRAKNRARRRSDLDLAIGGSEPLPLNLTIDLKEDFLESDLPYFVDLVDVNAISPEFRARIQRDFVLIQAGSPVAQEVGA
jgi:predicted nucleotidyltransferase